MDGAIDFDHYDRLFQEAEKRAANHKPLEIPASAEIRRFLFIVADTDGRHFQKVSVRFASRLARDRDIIWGKDIGALLAYQVVELESLAINELADYCNSLSLYRAHVTTEEMRAIFEASKGFWEFAKSARDNFPLLSRWCSWFHGAVTAPGRSKSRVDFSAIKDDFVPHSPEVKKFYEKCFRNWVHTARQGKQPEDRDTIANLFIIRIGNSPNLLLLVHLLKILCAIEKAISGVKSRLLDSLNLDEDQFIRSLVQSQFNALPKDDVDLLASDPAVANLPSFKEFLSTKQKPKALLARPRTKTPPPPIRPLRDDEPLSPRLHKYQIAKIFRCGRNNVDQSVLATVPYRQTGLTFEISMAYMPPEYQKKHSADGQASKPDFPRVAMLAEEIA